MWHKVGTGCDGGGGEGCGRGASGYEFYHGDVR